MNAQLTKWPEKLNISQIYEAFKSPAWIINEDQLVSNVEQYADFTGDRSRILYPVKTNPSLTVLQILGKLGAGADCASRLEINLALLSGIRIENISYNAPVQDTTLCGFLLRSGGRVVMDDPEAIAELQSQLNGCEFRGKLLLRINLPDYIGYAQADENQDLMNHGHTSSKFGIPAEELQQVLGQIRIPVSGLHVHVGTQMDNMDSFDHAIRSLNEIAAGLNRLGHRITEINLGGGLGIPFTKKAAFPSLEYWCTFLKPLKNKDFHYFVEPGHALIGNAVALLTKIQAIKNSRGKRWAIADVGTDQLAKVTLLKWPHRILNKAGKEPDPGKDAIAGPLCFAGDILVDNIDASNLTKGDPLLITEAGAYTFSLSNKFNGRLAPKWLLMKADGKIVQTMEAESIFDDLQNARFDWNAAGEQSSGRIVDLSLANKLSSHYLKTTCREDYFEYTGIELVAVNYYKFKVRTQSPVHFISMPFAIRIFGDASIISVMHKGGFQNKDVSVWGRKLTMDCYDLLNSGEMTFFISLSEFIQTGEKHTIAARFKTSCEKCSGSFIITY